MKVFVSLVVLLGFVTMATSLDCYACDIDDTPACKDPISKDTLKDIKKVTVPEGGVCTKVKGKDRAGNAALVRSALTVSDLCVGGPNGCKSISDADGSGEFCCCTGDLCNGAAGLHQNSFILFAIISGVLMVVNRFY